MKETVIFHADQNGLPLGADRTAQTTSFGELVVGVYDTCDNPGAGALVSLALRIGLLDLSEPKLGDDQPVSGREQGHAEIANPEARWDQC